MSRRSGGVFRVSSGRPRSRTQSRSRSPLLRSLSLLLSSLSAAHRGAPLRFQLAYNDLPLLCAVFPRPARLAEMTGELVLATLVYNCRGGSRRCTGLPGHLSPMFEPDNRKGYSAGPLTARSCDRAVVRWFSPFSYPCAAGIPSGPAPPPLVSERCPCGAADFAIYRERVIFETGSSSHPKISKPHSKCAPR